MTSRLIHLCEARPLRGYKLCKECGQPMLKRGQVRKHPDAYRHASGCPADTKAARGSS